MRRALDQQTEAFASLHPGASWPRPYELFTLIDDLRSRRGIIGRIADSRALARRTLQRAGLLRRGLQCPLLRRAAFRAASNAAILCR